MLSHSIDYSIFYKKKYSSTSELRDDSAYDLFISAYNDSARVKEVFSMITAAKKHWLVFPEYGYLVSEEPKEAEASEKIFTFDKNLRESTLIRNYIDQAEIDLTSIGKVCIDITGFIRPHLVFLVRYLHLNQVGSVDFIYSDPVKYKKKEHTDFSFDYTQVRQIDGCQGSHSTNTGNDFLIIGAGYDHLRITDVSKNKDNTKKIQLFGFPSLQPDMYQENILKAYKAAEETVSKGEEVFIDEDNAIFAPANDPFVTANIISQFVKREYKKKQITNLYLCPLSTKAQTLGMSLFYVSECLDLPCSIIFPICERYSKETTEGISKIWKYVVEFDKLQ